MESFIAIAAALTPVAMALFAIIQLVDHPPPTIVVLRTFWLGMLITPLMTFYGLLYRTIRLPPTGVAWINALFDALTSAALPEELLKFLVIYFYCSRLPQFRDPMAGVLLGAAASLGFAAYENMTMFANGGLEHAPLRSVTAVPAHACFGALMGYYYQRARRVERRSQGRFDLTLLGLGVAVLLHTLYDFSLLLLQHGTHAALVEGGSWRILAWQWSAVLLCLATLSGTLWWTGHVVIRERTLRRRRARLAARHESAAVRSSFGETSDVPSSSSDRR